MTDPRIAALADILTDAMYAKGYQNPKLFAAEIVKRLPPDWCGHRPVDIARELDLVQRLAKAEYDLARLRRIEEAARGLAEYDMTFTLRDGAVVAAQSDVDGLLDHLLALRAALEDR